MMGEPPETKRLRLSLEPSIDLPEWDITDKGDEIHRREPSLSEKLLGNVDRVWRERGEWRDISEKALTQSIAASGDSPSPNETIAESDTKKMDHAPSTVTEPRVDIWALRSSVLEKLNKAKSEIGVALDVINILTASHGHTQAAENLVLPPGSVHTTYVAKPQATQKAKLETLQLTMGLKRKQQQGAAAYLKKRADSLHKIIKSENTFWEEALDMRRNHWPMLFREKPLDVRRAMKQPGASLSVQYGFTDADSKFSEVSFGEMVRSTNGKDRMHLVLSHKQPSTMIVSVYKSTKLDRNILQDATDTRQHSHRDTTHPHKIAQPSSSIQKQLMTARSTVFDTELFSMISSEAQLPKQLLRSVRFAENQIVVPIDGQTDLAIKKIIDNPQDEEDVDTEKEVMAGQHKMGETIDLALRLLLIQKHQMNASKARTRLLSVNPKLHPPEKNSESSILSTVLSMAQFWSLFDGIRQIVDNIVRPLCHQGGMDMAIHYEFQKPSKESNGGLSNQILGVLAISVLKGPSLHFTLNLSGNITVSVRHLTVTLKSLAEFEAFLSREVDLICLDRVCQVANELVQLSAAYKPAGYNDKVRFLWKVDGVEESVNGSLWWRSSKSPSSHNWRTILVHVVRTSQTYSLQFQLGAVQDIPAESFSLTLTESGPSKMQMVSLCFNEKIELIVQGVLDRGAKGL